VGNSQIKGVDRRRKRDLDIEVLERERESGEVLYAEWMMKWSVYIVVFYLLWKHKNISEVESYNFSNQQILSYPLLHWMGKGEKASAPLSHVEKSVPNWVHAVHTPAGYIKKLFFLSEFLFRHFPRLSSLLSSTWNFILDTSLALD